LIQRDYSNGNLYDYYTNGGVGSDSSSEGTPKGPEAKTDSGRVVYSGGGISPDVALKPDTMTEELFQTFKKFAVEKYKYTPAQIDKEREFVERTLRSELVGAAFGTQTSLQVGNEYDTQLLKAVELMPQAKQLALEGAKAKDATRLRSEVNR
jgi:carboxyl-terminal processing protease